MKIRIQERERELKLLQHKIKLNSFMSSKEEKNRLKIKAHLLTEDIKELLKDYATFTSKSK